jgi:signal transduction histidine kinase
LTGRWLEWIAQRTHLSAEDVFPTHDLLDHIPLLIDGIAEYIADPVEDITADVPVIAKAMDLGRLRHDQGLGPSEILKEYEAFGGILFHELATGFKHDQPCRGGELIVCCQRLFRAIAVIQEATATSYLAEADGRIQDREQRLRSFSYAVSHEIKNRLTALRGAAQMLSEDFVRSDVKRRMQFEDILSKNVNDLQKVVDDLIDLSRLDGGSTGEERVVPLVESIREVCEQLRDHADSAGVTLRAIEPLPEVPVPGAVVELCLSNLVSNAIKYHDSKKASRIVEIRAEVTATEAKVEVCDNGIGVPEESRKDLFRRFFRAHKPGTGDEGTGLGLSIVRETVELLGGRAWVDFDTEGVTIFGFALPLHRP